MALITGEAIYDYGIGKWGYIIKHQDGTIISSPEFIFASQTEAEQELIYLLQNLAEYSKKK